MVQPSAGKFVYLLLFALMTVLVQFGENSLDKSFFVASTADDASRREKPIKRHGSLLAELGLIEVSYDENSISFAETLRDLNKSTVSESTGALGSRSVIKKISADVAKVLTPSCGIPVGLLNVFARGI